MITNQSFTLALITILSAIVILGGGCFEPEPRGVDEPPTTPIIERVKPDDKKLKEKRIEVPKPIEVPKISYDTINTISAEDLRDFINKSKEYKKGLELTHTLFTNENTQPVKFLTVRDRSFLLSEIMCAPPEKRKYAILYGQCQPNIYCPLYLYKSQSAGGWRVSPTVDLDNSPRYSKGNFHYTQEAKPVPEIVFALEQLEKKTMQQD